MYVCMGGIDSVSILICVNMHAYVCASISVFLNACLCEYKCVFEYLFVRV